MAQWFSLRLVRNLKFGDSFPWKGKVDRERRKRDGKVDNKVKTINETFLVLLPINAKAIRGMQFAVRRHGAGPRNVAGQVAGDPEDSHLYWWVLPQLPLPPQPW